MSKIIATSGNQAPVLKGSGTSGDATADAAGLFAALFGGVQIAEAESDADPAQSDLQTGATNSEQVFDTHLAAMLGIKQQSILGQGKSASVSDAIDDAQTDSFEMQTDNFDVESDKLPDAGLMAADSQLSQNGQHMAGHKSLQNRFQMATLAEDMKQADVKTSAEQNQQPGEPDEDFIGPPLPRVILKSVPVKHEQSDNNLKKVIIAARQTALSQTDIPQESVLKAEVSNSALSNEVANELADADVLDAASLKADRMPELAGRPADRTAHIGTPSVQLASSAADPQTGLLAVSHQANSTQTGGQHSGSGSAFAGTAQTDLSEHWLDVLDVQDEKWTEQLVRRIDREFRRGGKGIELELNPRNLGRLKVTLSVAQEQTNVVLRTETGAATQVLSDAEGRLAQMLSDVGLKLGQFDAYTGGQNRGFGQQDRQQKQNGGVAEVENDSHTGDTDTSDGLVNLKA